MYVCMYVGWQQFTTTNLPTSPISTEPYVLGRKKPNEKKNND